MCTQVVEHRVFRVCELTEEVEDPILFGSSIVVLRQQPEQAVRAGHQVLPSILKRTDVYVNCYRYKQRVDIQYTWRIFCDCDLKKQDIS